MEGRSEASEGGKTSLQRECATVFALVVTEKAFKLKNEGSHRSNTSHSEVKAAIRPLISLTSRKPCPVATVSPLTSHMGSWRLGGQLFLECRNL